MSTTTRQRLAGSFVLGIAALAFYFGTQWKGPGLGGSGTGSGHSGTANSSSNTDEADSNDTPRLASTGNSEITGDEAPEKATLAIEEKTTPLVTVVITGSEYLLSLSEDIKEARATPMAEVARAAMQATGDSQGIKIRIFRKKDATAGARIDLFSKLNEAGIPNEAIQEMRTFLD